MSICQEHPKEMLSHDFHLKLAGNNQFFLERVLDMTW